MTLGYNRLAGDGTSASTDGPALSAEFALPQSVAAYGGALYVNDTNTIRKISGGTVSTFCDPGLGYVFTGPMAVDSLGHLYVAGLVYNATTSTYGEGIYKASTDGSIIVPWSGTTGASDYRDGPFDWAQYRSITGMAVDASDNIYVSDAGFPPDVIRKVSPDGSVVTLAGSSTRGYVDGAFDIAQFSDPVGMSVIGSTLYVADHNNAAIRAVNTSTGAVSTLVVLSLDGSPLYPDGIAVGPDGKLYVLTDSNLITVTTSGTVEVVLDTRYYDTYYEFPGDGHNTYSVESPTWLAGNLYFAGLFSYRVLVMGTLPDPGGGGGGFGDIPYDDSGDDTWTPDASYTVPDQPAKPEKECATLLQLVQDFSAAVRRAVRITGPNSIEVVNPEAPLPTGFTNARAREMYSGATQTQKAGDAVLSLLKGNLTLEASANIITDDVRIPVSSWKIPDHLPSYAVNPAKVTRVTYTFTPQHFTGSVTFHFNDVPLRVRRT